MKTTLLIRKLSAIVMVLIFTSTTANATVTTNPTATHNDIIEQLLQWLKPQPEQAPQKTCPSYPECGNIAAPNEQPE